MSILHETADCDRVRNMERVARLARMNPKPKPVIIEIAPPVAPVPIQVEHQLVKTVPVPDIEPEIIRQMWSFAVDPCKGENQTPSPSLERIKKVVARKFKITLIDMESARRTRDVVWPRQIACYLCATMTRRSLPAIGRAFGDRDHTTILHSRDKVAKLITEDIHLNEKILALKEAILATSNESLGVPSGTPVPRSRADQTDVAVPEVQVPPPPIDLAHNKTRSEQGGSSA